MADDGKIKAAKDHGIALPFKQEFKGFLDKCFGRDCPARQFFVVALGECDDVRGGSGPTNSDFEGFVVFFHDINVCHLLIPLTRYSNYPY